jgi:hypothetical protein
MYVKFIIMDSLESYYTTQHFPLILPNLSQDSKPQVSQNTTKQQL